MNAHQTALARLTGARAQHTITDATADLLDIVLRRHPEDCDGVRHITGRVECEVFRAALRVLGIGGAS